MKKINLILCFALVALGIKAQEIIPLIPKPLKAVKHEGYFALSNSTQINASTELSNIAQYLQSELLKHQGITLRMADKAGQNSIELQIKKSKNTAETYQLSIGNNKIQIIATDKKGIFNGVSSLLQLIRQQSKRAETVQLACWTVNDQPRYAWRGFMLDESRHFFGKEKVKQILDWMAFYKLNKFHWHLTDQPGWRVEIKKYPKLTLIGGIGTYTDSLAKAQYYTQEEIKEIVRYATERFIDVIPEIDMPGHATAANKAYPQYSGGGSVKHPEFTFNPGKEETYQYLTNILKEIDVLFPSQMIHIGADEVHYGNEKWNTDSNVQQLMKDKGLKNLSAVEAYFVKRMADSIRLMNNEVLAWDEVVGGSLNADRTTVLWWRHDKPEVLKEALSKDYKVILCPRIPLYFDFVQDASHTVGRKWAGNFVALESVYNFPSDEIVNLPNADKLIRGMQANLWTEVVTNNEQLDYKIFPRISALAEAAWTANELKNMDDFNKRLKRHLALFNQDDLYFYNPFNPKASPDLLSPMQRKGMLPKPEALTNQESKPIK